MNAQQLVDERGDLWLALAPLWLDREPRERDYAHMVEVIQEHNMTLSELEWMFRLELAPVMSRHQLSIASEWRQFDDRKLMQQLVSHNLRLKGWRRKSWALFSGLTTMMVRHRWVELMNRVQVAKGQSLERRQPRLIRDQARLPALGATGGRGLAGQNAQLSGRHALPKTW